MARLFRLTDRVKRVLLSGMLSEASSSVPAAMQVASFEISSGDKGTRQTLEHMRRIIYEELKDKKYGAWMRGLALRITDEAGCKTKEFKCEAKSLFEWVRDNIRWVRDTKGIETLQYPHRTVAFKAGDCDDLTILNGALATSIGIPCMMRAIAANPKNKNSYSHVYLMVDPMGNDKWVACDATVKTAGYGWESPVQYKRMDVPI